jgi:hypothetical protein
MAKNQAEFERLIQSISDGSFTEDLIQLRNAGITDADAQKLCAALISRPDVAAHITSLDFSSNNLTSISIPDALVNLRLLELDHNQLTSISIPNTLVKLRLLELDHNQLTSISIPETLEKLEYLDLSNNQLTGIGIPQTLVKLTYIYLNHNQLTNISITDTLVNLKTLHLHNNQLTSISIPQTLVKLKHLDLSNNQLTGINIPSTLVNLVTLMLGYNQLTTISIPETLQELRILNIHSNQLPPLPLLMLRAMRTQNLWLEIIGLPPGNIVITPETVAPYLQTQFSPPATLGTIHPIYPNVFTMAQAKDIVTAYLICSIHLSEASKEIAVHVAKYLTPAAPARENAVAAIKPYLPSTFFAWLPEGLKPSQDVMRALSDSETQVITTAQQMPARMMLNQFKVCTQRLTVSKIASTLAGLNKEIHKQINNRKTQRISIMQRILAKLNQMIYGRHAAFYKMTGAQYQALLANICASTNIGADVKQAAQARIRRALKHG